MKRNKLPPEKLGRSLKEALKPWFDQAYSESWDEMMINLHEEVYVSLAAYDDCEIGIVDNSAGQEWFMVPLHAAISEFMISHSLSDDVQWSENMIAAFERQIKRLRSHISKLKAKSPPAKPGP